MSHLTILSVLLLSVGVSWAEGPPDMVTVERDIAYIDGPDADPDRQRLDIYQPPGQGPFPVLMWIHGGAWAIGHRRQEESLARRLAEQGIALVAIDHRMSKALWMDPNLDEGVEHPAHVEDCAAAFAWVRGHGEQYRWDIDRLYVGGFSSGAHLTALLALDPRYLKAHDLPLISIRGALPVGGAYDIEAYYRAHVEANGREMADQHVLDVFGHQEGALREASPTTYLGRSSVPMLVISERDTFSYTQVFEEAVGESNVSHIRFTHHLDRTHQSILVLMSRDGDDEVRGRLVAFIDESSP